jgi:hypothetical protein
MISCCRWPGTGGVLRRRSGRSAAGEPGVDACRAGSRLHQEHRPSEPGGGWIGGGDGAPPADPVSCGRGRTARPSPSPRACSVRSSSAGGAGSWAHRSAVAHQVAGWGVHAHRLPAGRSGGCFVGCCLRSPPSLDLLVAGGAASMPCERACARGHWSLVPLDVRPCTRVAARGDPCGRAVDQHAAWKERTHVCVSTHRPPRPARGW